MNTKNVFGFLAILFFVFYSLRRRSSQGGRARRYSSTHRESLYARSEAHDHLVLRLRARRSDKVASPARKPCFRAGLFFLYTRLHSLPHLCYSVRHRWRHSYQHCRTQKLFSQSSSSSASCSSSAARPWAGRLEAIISRRPFISAEALKSFCSKRPLLSRYSSCSRR